MNRGFIESISYEIWYQKVHDGLMQVLQLKVLTVKIIALVDWEKHKQEIVQRWVQSLLVEAPL